MIWAGGASLATVHNPALHAQESVTVVGARLGAKPGDGPLLRIEGTDLDANRGSTLGETLSLLPGVQHSAFGPNSSRPTIRGLDQDRVKVLQGGGGMQDLSSFSADHAVAVDTLLIDRIEVLRGPAALLYGGNAMGGVINLVDRRIVRGASDLASSRLLLQSGNVANDRQAGAVLAGPLGPGPGGGAPSGSSHAAGQLFGHVDVSGYRAGDTRTPAFTLVDHHSGEVSGPFRRIRNSDSDQRSAGAGLSWVGSAGFIGAAIDEIRKDYGVTAEEATRIEMQRRRSRLEGERVIGGSQNFKIGFRLGQTNYRHDELEDGEATRFSNRSSDWRTELSFGRAGQYSGVVGLEGERQRFSALEPDGAFAFVPPNQTRKTAAFLLQRLPLGSTELQLAARQEEVRVSSEAFKTSGLAGGVTSGLDTRSFSPRSLSVSFSAPLAQGLSALGSLSRAERAPSAFELLADGIHHAAGTLEKGDPSLPLEKGDLADLTLNYRQGDQQLRVSVYQSKFKRYISLVRDPSLDAEHDQDHDDASAPSGTAAEEHAHEEALVPGYRYTALRARFRGMELSWTTRLRLGNTTLRPLVQVDLTRGVNSETGEAFARIAPRRLILAAGWTGQTSMGHAWLLRPEIVLAAAGRQTGEDRDSDSVPAPSYQLLNLFAAFEPQGLKGLGKGMSFYARARNLTNALAYNATALPNIRALSPLAGRSLQLGVQLRF
jgi:iron complex outermembrane receptor protein